MKITEIDDFSQELFPVERQNNTVAVSITLDDGHVIDVFIRQNEDDGTYEVYGG